MMIVYIMVALTLGAILTYFMTQSSARSPLDVYRGYFDVVDQAAHKPGDRDWSADITRHAIDPLASESIATWRGYQDRGIRMTGAARYSPVVVLQTADTAIIHDCVDTTGVQLSRDGRPIARPPGYLDHQLVRSTVRLTKEGWRLASVERTEPRNRC